jgi:hypothetical protein
MSRYQIKVNVSGSWANLCNFPPEKLDAVTAACALLACALDHGIVFKVIDAQTESTVLQYNNRPKTGEPNGWYVPYQPAGHLAPIVVPNPQFSTTAQEAKP